MILRHGSKHRFSAHEIVYTNPCYDKHRNRRSIIYALYIMQPLEIITIWVFLSGVVLVNLEITPGG